MTDLFQEMCSTFELQWITPNQANGSSVDMGWGRLFGGQLLAQATAAAQEHPQTSGSVHSIHAHFVAFGHVHKEVQYHLHPIRQGRSFSSIRVEALQDQTVIFHATLGFQIPEQGLEYQKEMPLVPPPEELSTYQHTLQTMVEKLSPAQFDQLSPLWVERLYLPPALDVRPIRPTNFFVPDSTQPERLLWFRASQSLPDRPEIHQQVVIWASDFPMLGTALQPHNIPPSLRVMQMASLDHSVWVHAPFRADEWLLCHIKSPRTGGGRGIAFADIYQQDGTLVANCAQEGLLRRRHSSTVS